VDDVTFREATAADLPALLRLLVDDDLAQARGGYAAEVTPAVRAAFDAIERDPGNELWLGERDGEVVAMLQLTLIPGLSRGGMKRALVEAVRVRADLRGRGIGEALMRHVEQRAKAAGCGLIQLTTDRQRLAAHRFYERLGYVASHLGMKKKLRANDDPAPPDAASLRS
jgi:GNAT superfamily N-acetyltransferase